MTDKLIRGDGVTELVGVKSCVFTERVNAEENLRPGCVAAASISVEVYGSQATAPTAGEEITYYQVDSNGVGTLIGKFYAEPSVPTKSTYKFTAYDAAAKLDTDFSERLWSISADFPMTIADIVSEACDVAGVTLGSATWPLSTQTVNEFFSDGVTCRQIVSWAAEIACCYVRCDTAGELVFDWYAEKSGYKIAPTSGTSGGVTNIPYKQDGMDYENYAVDPIQFVAVRPIDTEGVAYIYPSTYVDVGASDPGETGNVMLTDISAVDDGNGNVEITSFINVSDDGEGNLVIANGESGGNTLVVFDNLLLCDADTAVMTAVAQNIYTRMALVGSYRPARVNLFPFDNPFRAGDIVAVTDIQGVSFSTIAMEMSVSRAVATVTSTGRKEQKDTPVNTQSRMARLGENIVRIKNLVVGSLQAVTARIDQLFATNITCTGSFEVDNGVYYLTQTSDGFEMGSVDQETEPPSPSTKISANSTDGVTMQTFLNRGIALSTVGSSGSIVLRTGNVGSTQVIGGLMTDYLRDSNGNFGVFYRRKTVTYTTNSNGLANLSLNSDYGIICVRRTDTGSICTPYYSRSSDNWWVRITDLTGNIIASTAVTLEVLYFDSTGVIPG